MSVFVIVSALTFVIYLQTGAYMLWKNPRAQLNRWFFIVSLYLAFYSVGSILLNEPFEGIYADFVRKSGWGVSFMLLFRFHSVLTAYPRNRVYHDLLFFFFIVFGAGLSLFLYVVLFSFDQSRLHLLEDWVWTNQIVDTVYYLVMLVFLISLAFMYVSWRKGTAWKKEKQRFLVFFIFFAFFGPALIIIEHLTPEATFMNYVRLPHVYVLPWFAGISYGFVNYRFLPQDPAKASRKLLLELKQVLFFCDHQGFVIESNPYSVQLIGKSAHEIRGSNVIQLFLDADKIENLIRKTINQDMSGQEMVTLKSRNGTGIPVSLSTTVLRDRFGDEHGIVLYGKDQRDTIALKEEINKRNLIEVSLQSMSGDLELQVEKNTEALRTSLNETTLKIADRKRTEDAIKAEIADMEVMMDEIHTRVRTNIEMILALLRLKDKEGVATEIQTSESTLRKRIHTILLVNNQIQTHDSYGLVNFKGFLISLRELYEDSLTQDRQIKMDITAATDLIWVDQAIPLAMVANELINNSIRHAFVNRKDSDPELKIVFSIVESSVCKLQIKDNGCGFIPENQFAGDDYSGLQLVKMLVIDQLNGSFVINSENGVCVLITFPLYQKRQGHIGVN